MAFLVATSLDAIDTSNEENDIYGKDIQLGQKQSIEGIPTNRSTNGYRSRSTNKRYQHSYPVVDLDLERWNWNCCARTNLMMEKDGDGDRDDRGDDGVRVVGSDYGPGFTDDDGDDGDDRDHRGDRYRDHRDIQQTFDVWEKGEDDDTENHSEFMTPGFLFDFVTIIMIHFLFICLRL